MREILFRGKRIDNGEWVEGFLLAGTDCVYPGRAFICEKLYAAFCDSGEDDLILGGFVEVDPSTVGQYTGLTDKNGKRIFEGDIIEGREYTDEDGYGVVEWDDGAYEVGNKSWCGTFHENYNGCEFEVIGNIHDNPELLKEAET